MTHPVAARTTDAAQAWLASLDDTQRGGRRCEAGYLCGMATSISGRADAMKIRRFSRVESLRRGATSQLVDVILTWNRQRPHEIALQLQAPGHRPDRWVFARELLAEGLIGPAGLGAVTLMPGLSGAHPGKWVELVLSAPDSAVAVLLRVSGLREFLDQLPVIRQRKRGA